MIYSFQFGKGGGTSPLPPKGGGKLTKFKGFKNKQEMCIERGKLVKYKLAKYTSFVKSVIYKKGKLREAPNLFMNMGDPTA